MTDVVDGNARQDAELHADWQAGDHRAATKLVRRYRDRLVGLGRSKGLSDADAEELAQEVLLAAPLSRFEAREGATYWSWLATIAGRKVTKMLERCEGTALPRRCTSPWTGLVRERLLEDVAEMAATQRKVLELAFVGLDRQEIAAELGMPPVAIGMRIYRGRQWLRARGH